MKRVSDLSLCLVSGILILPLCIIIAIIIKMEDGAEVFYRGERIGRNGKIFRMLKFRTMKDEIFLSAEEEEEFRLRFKLNDDPRLTKTGKWLRQYSLDEIPQFYNVLKGEMSVVGPRPKLPQEMILFESVRTELLSILPGITGYWQVSRKNANSDDSMREMDLYYIRNRNILLDLKILLLTPITVLRRKNY